MSEIICSSCVYVVLKIKHKKDAIFEEDVG